MENVKELRKLIALAKKSGLKSLKLGDISFEFNDAKPEAKPSARPLGLGDPLSSDAVMPRDDELLYASTPYYQELISQRAEANKPQEN